MKIILDSNILFSALIKNSTTRKIILEYSDYFLFPYYIFDEMQKYKQILLKKSKMSNYDFNLLVQLLLGKVLIIPKDILLPFRNKAKNIVNKIDPNDAIFIACGLAYSDSIIWSDDKKLKNQNVVPILNTQEIIKLLFD